ncbi:hypothetical protein [Novosphingobium malaysiense]|uniref:hypothetical protein n=1 Tax=Novosphingobium malaysiense TaxID=1348853 RepID=UPI0012E05E8E|nr:hypothetical protein [Novosphingobium malaysiense]
MAFVGSPVSGKTLDVQRGLELFSFGGGPDGIENWQIVASDGHGISFSTAWEQDFVDEWRRRNPDAYKPAIYLVQPIRGCLAGLSQTATDSIIVEALTAFKGFHGKPEGGHVTVVFEPSGLSRNSAGWWEQLFKT